MNAFDLYFNRVWPQEPKKEENLLKLGLRKCRDCKEVKSLDMFYKKGKRNGKQETRTECKPCSGIRKKLNF